MLAVSQVSCTYNEGSRYPPLTGTIYGRDAAECPGTRDEAVAGAHHVAAATCFGGALASRSTAAVPFPLLQTLIPLKVACHVDFVLQNKLDPPKQYHALTLTVAMASNHSDQPPGNMFPIVKSASNTLAPRLARLALPGREVIDTPHYIGLTSRGVIPHLSQDNFARLSSINGVYTPLEDCEYRLLSIHLAPTR